jgi:FkbM family methyltransferase
MHKLTTLMNIAYAQEVHLTGVPHFFNDHKCFSEYYDLVLKRDADVIDLGFNIGLQAEILLQKTCGTIYGFEASRRIYGRAKERFFNESRVQLFNLAITDQSGTAEFIDTDNWGAGSLQFTSGMKYCGVGDDYMKYNVDTARLDEILPEASNIGLIKLDIEGSELPALSGARKLIERNRPYMVLEYCHNALSFQLNGEPINSTTLYKYAAEIGYKVYNIYGICLSNKDVWETSIFRDTADVFLIPEEMHMQWAEQQLPLYQYRVFDSFLERLEWPPHTESNYHYGLSALPSRLYEFVNHHPAEDHREHFTQQREKLISKIKGEQEIIYNSQLSSRGKVLLMLLYRENLDAAIRLAATKNVSEHELLEYSNLANFTAVD